MDTMSFCMRSDHLPRQARDERKENSSKERATTFLARRRCGICMSTWQPGNDSTFTGEFLCSEPPQNISNLSLSLSLYLT